MPGTPYQSPDPKARRAEHTAVTVTTSVEDHGFAPLHALNLVDSDGDVIVSGDHSYDGFAPRSDLTDAAVTSLRNH